MGSIRVVLRRVLAWGLAVAVVACGGGGSAPPVDAGAGDLSPAQRQVIYDGVDAAADAAIAAGGGPEAEAAAVDAYLASRPEVVSHGVVDGRVAWARFIDGRALVVGATRVPQPAGAAPAATRRATPLAATEMPGATGTRLFNSFGPGREFLGQAVNLSPPLVAHGYEPPAPSQSDGTLADWESATGAGVVYVDSHGIRLPETAGDGAPMVGVLATATRMSAAIDTERAAELRAGQLVHVKRLPMNGGKFDVYGVTPAWVRAHVRLSAGALVIINTCNLGDPALGMAKAFLDVGADAVFGWDKPVEDRSAARWAQFAIDRLFGDNALEYAPTDAVRPLDFAELLTAAQTTEDPTREYLPFAVSSGTNARLRLATADASARPTTTALVPIIRAATLDSANQTATLSGTFGSVPGAVHEATVNGNVVTLGAMLSYESWTPTSIKVVLLPTTRRVAVRVASHTGNAWAFPTGTYRITGDTADGSMEFRDDVTIWRNGTVLYDDRNGTTTVHAPIDFDATRADTLRIQVRSSKTFGGSSAISLVTPGGTRFRLMAEVFDLVTPPSGIVRDQNFELRNY